MYLNFDLLDKILNSRYYFDSLSCNACLSSEKGYDLIEHAYDLIALDDVFCLADAITNLRKAINYRVTDLFKNLGLEHLNFNQLGKDRKLEKLGTLGIIKPLLINKLRKIRNGIEYDGNDPPTKEECEELVDIVWYFYRSTDRYCNIKPDELIVEWEEDGQSYYFGISFDFSKHSGIIVKGRFPEKYISQEKEYLYSIPLKKVTTKDYSENDIASKFKLFHIFHEAEIERENLNDYLELLTIALVEWGI